MFICSIRAATVRFFGVLLVALVTLIALIAFVPELQPAAATAATAGQDGIRYEDVKTNEDRIRFLSQFGYLVQEKEKECVSVRLPEEFDKVFTAYNELQRAQGLDLAPYAGRTAERYTYVITNYEGYEGEVLANLLVFRGRVIGGDVCSADSGGFLHGFEKQPRT